MPSLASDMSSITRGGSTNDPTNPGHNATPGSGAKGGSGVRRPPQAPQAPARAMPRRGPPPATPQHMMARPAPQQRARFSANNPPMGTAPPPTPHPGLAPPYPDARSAQPTMLPNGSTVMPPPAGFIQPNMPPRVPPTFIPGMTGLLRMR